MRANDGLRDALLGLLHGLRNPGGAAAVASKKGLWAIIAGFLVAAKKFAFASEQKCNIAPSTSLLANHLLLQDQIF